MLVPDYFEPLVGWRAWKVVGEGLLSGRHQAEPWIPGERMTSRCAKPVSAHLRAGVYQHPPVAKCTCGVHAYKERAEALAEVTPSDSFLYWGGEPETYVYGTVSLWGRVLEHERGYRAEFAYPKELIAFNEKIAEQVADLYRVKVSVEEIPKQAESFAGQRGMAGYLGQMQQQQYHQMAQMMNIQSSPIFYDPSSKGGYSGYYYTTPPASIMPGPAQQIEPRKKSFVEMAKDLGLF